MTTKFIGSNDSSVEKLEGDLFDISMYVSGLTKSVRSCVTPMTISIQGDWGSGKTSMMPKTAKSKRPLFRSLQILLLLILNYCKRSCKNSIIS